MSSNNSAGPPGPCLPRGPHFDTRSVISVISRIGSASVLIRFNSPALSSAEIHSLKSLYANSYPPVCGLTTETQRKLRKEETFRSAWCLPVEGRECCAHRRESLLSSDK